MSTDRRDACTEKQLGQNFSSRDTVGCLLQTTQQEAQVEPQAVLIIKRARPACCDPC